MVAGAFGRVPARRLAGCEIPPLLELCVAVAARTAWHAARVEVGVLVEGNLEAAVLVAKDVTALAAVVAAREVAEVPLAGRVIAHGGLVVGLRAHVRSACLLVTGRGRRRKAQKETTYLPVLPSRCAGGFREMIKIPGTVDALGTLARRPPAQPPKCAQATETHEAAVGPQAVLGDVFLILEP